MRGTSVWIVAESSILFYRHFCGILGENHVIFSHILARKSCDFFFAHFGAKSRDFYMHGAPTHGDLHE